MDQDQNLTTYSNENLLTLWRTQRSDPKESDDPEEQPKYLKRNRITKEIQKRKLFPEDETDSSIVGLYPDVDDPNFISRLLKKSEFADTYSPPLSSEDNPCLSEAEFEVTPVQRFISNFLHPRTPYMSALLYHGVGVGKTCAAIQSAEAYLDFYPRRKVIIVAPPTIQAGFYRTIFDINNLVIGSGESSNRATGCTNNTYLRLAGLTYERNKEIIEKDIRKVIKSRYEFYGYLQFRNHIRNILKKVSSRGDKNEVRLREIDALKKEFNYRLLIIDEAHNLRDVASTVTIEEEEEEETDTVGTEDEKDEAKAGKLLTPFLNYLLDATDGMKLLLMTATPMFNTSLEIVHIINLLLRNDKKATITQDMIMDSRGNLIDGAEDILKPIANAYISFMRGENPNSFPLRLFPEGNDPNGRPMMRITDSNYPQIAFGKGEVGVNLDDKKRVSRLPLLKSESLEGSLSFNVMKSLTETGSAKGSNYMIVDSLLQAGNCVFPYGETGNAESYVGLKGFQNTFVKKGKGVISAKGGDASWLLEDNLNRFSPKISTILRLIKHSEGVDFVYSRFVMSGALMVALALEANGYTAYGRSSRLLEQGIQGDDGRQCAMCPARESYHDNNNHDFVPATYVLLTGDKELSPNNKASIDAARSDKNVNGGIVKVVLGSQIAGEGLDLRFIREVHILDAWFHLNKTEQIIGRGIRFRSHCLLEDKQKRNTTVYLHVLTINGYQKETADLYCYRSALLKAILVGQVSRRLKIFAVDCNLRKDVTVLTGLGTRIQKDSQGQIRDGDDGNGILLDDMPYTAMCDWMECTYTCDPVVQISVDGSDDSTYDSFSARYRETKIQKIIQKLFAQQTSYYSDDFLNILIESGAPRTAIDITIQGILNNRMFKVRSGSRDGYIIYKNKYFLFQPDSYKDINIPLSIRVADFPIRRDEFTPSVMNKVVQEEVETKVSESISNDLWKHLLTWVNSVVSGKQTSIGKEIESQIDLYTPDFSQQRKSYTDKLEMIVFLASRIKPEFVDNYKQIVLEYLWDEWLDNTTQFSYYQKKDETILSIAAENIVRDSTGYEAFRYVDSETNALKYLCEDGEPCSFGVIEALSKIKDNPTGSKAVEGRTGSLYGFVVPKVGRMVFKTNKPHKEGEPVIGGQECANVAAKDYIIKLISIMDEISKYNIPIINFEEKHLYMKPNKPKNPDDKNIYISNSARGCTLLDLILRFMDNVSTSKRWFFRPLSAYYSGHLGRITQEAKMQDKKAKKIIKDELKKEKKNPTVAVAAPAKTAEVSVKPKAYTLVRPKKTVVEPSVPAVIEEPKPVVSQVPIEEPKPAPSIPKIVRVPKPLVPVEEPKPAPSIPRVIRVPKPAVPVEEPRPLAPVESNHDSDNESNVVTDNNTP